MERSYQFNNSTVTIKFGSIIDSDSEVIVSSDDSHISMGGGISASILNAGGQEILTDTKKHIPAQLGNVVVTSSGNMKQKYIFHAITIDRSLSERLTYSEEQITQIQQFIIRHSVQHCLKLMPVLGVNSLAFPCIGTGVAHIPHQLAAECMSEAIAEILFATNKSYLIEIYLFDRFGKMGQIDYIPFFESFASLSYTGKINLPNKGSIEKVSSDVEVIDAEQNMKHKVFISYKHEDYEKIKGICGMLNEINVPYWIDINGRYSGTNYKDVIVNAIKRSNLVLFISSSLSNKSPNVQKEIGLADKYNKVIIPIKLDNTPFSPCIDYDLNNIDNIDYSNQDVVTLEKIKQTILGRLAMEL